MLSESSSNNSENDDYELYVQSFDGSEQCITEDLTYGGKSSFFGKGTKIWQEEESKESKEQKTLTLTVDTCYNIELREDVYTSSIPTEEKLILKRKNKVVDEIDLAIPEPRGSESSGDDEEGDDKDKKSDDLDTIGYGETRETTDTSEKGREVTVHYFGRHDGMPRITQVVWKNLPLPKTVKKLLGKRKRKSNLTGKKAKARNVLKK